MTRREETIESNLKAIEEANAQYETNIQKIEDNLKAARLAAKQTQEKFATDALLEKEQMLSEIGQECWAKVNEAKEQLEKKMDELKKDLESESKILSEKIEKRLLF